jgi:hypothetical protein
MTPASFHYETSTQQTANTAAVQQALSSLPESSEDRWDREERRWQLEWSRRNVED